jgi:hypothetical protein
MSKNAEQVDAQVSTLTNEAARKRWEIFHLAIAHAKKSNLTAMEEADAKSAKSDRAGPMLSIAR